MLSHKEYIRTIRAKAGAKGGSAPHSPPSKPSGLAALGPETRRIISQMGVNARRNGSEGARRKCHLKICRASPAPIRVKGFGHTYDFCCWGHTLIGVNEIREEISG